MPPASRRVGRPARDEAEDPSSFVGFKVTAPERAQLTAAAEASGLTLSSYIRSRLIAAPAMRPRRRDSLDREALRPIHAQLSKIGSNVHQLLKRVNFGETPQLAEFSEALAGHREAIRAIMQHLGTPIR